MLMAVPVVSALMLSLLTGGSLRRLAALPLRGGYLLLASLSIQVLVYAPALRSARTVVHWSAPIYGVALGLALVAALRNWRLGVAARLATLGLLLNVIVIVANGGHMPVDLAALRTVAGRGLVGGVTNSRLYANTRPADQATRLGPLGDVIPVPLPGHHGNVYSVGDLLIVAGVSALAYGATRPPRTPVPTGGRIGTRRALRKHGWA